jgi:hypothetical protein
MVKVGSVEVAHVFQAADYDFVIQHVKFEGDSFSCCIPKIGFSIDVAVMVHM